MGCYILFFFSSAFSAFLNYIHTDHAAEDVTAGQGEDGETKEQGRKVGFLP